jgi:hypothetical protein
MPPAATAIAVNGTAMLVFDALEAMERLPFKAPADCGVHVMLTFALCFGARVIGIPMLFMLKPAPVTAAWVKVMLEPPEFVKVAEAFWLLPTVTVPNATGFELTERRPGVFVLEPVACVPVPATCSLMTSFWLAACVVCVSRAAVWKLDQGDTMETVAFAAILPLEIPVALGLKTTLKFTL